MAVLYLILLVFFSVEYFVMKKFSAIHQVVPVDFENLPHQQLLLPQQTAYSCQGYNYSEVEVNGEKRQAEEFSSDSCVSGLERHKGCVGHIPISLYIATGKKWEYIPLP